MSYIGKKLSEIKEQVSSQYPNHRVVVLGSAGPLSDDYVATRLTLYIDTNGVVQSQQLG